MKKVKRRTVAVLILALILALGIGFYIYKYAVDGSDWASFQSNETVFKDGILAVGTLEDRNGIVLASVDENGSRTFADDPYMRRAVFHVVGDEYGNVGTGALNVCRSELIGFDFINGAYSKSGKGNTLKLSVDAELNERALEALDGRKGTVVVANYETGEIVCMVSNPSYDPLDVPEIDDSDEWDGVYINRALSSAFTPGSIFKLVTAAAAIENIDDIFDRTFICEAEMQIGEDTVHCLSYHGEISFEDGLAQSCNCVFAQLAMELGPEILHEYALKYGLCETDLYCDGIELCEGNFDMGKEDIDIAWSGVGQYNDTVNPCAMVRFMSAIANEGTAYDLTLKKVSGISKLRSSGTQIMDPDTAKRLCELMNYNVESSYGADNFPGLELYAKSGTAELGTDVSPHAWFVGFIKNRNTPYAFVVMVQNGGWGSSVAGSVANSVLQAVIED